MFNIAAEKKFYSIGSIASTHDCTLVEVVRVANALGVLPAMEINDTPYFDGVGAGTIAGELFILADEREEQRNAAKKSKPRFDDEGNELPF